MKNMVFDWCLSLLLSPKKVITHSLLYECNYSTFAAMQMWDKKAGSHTVSPWSKHMITTITTNLLSPEFLNAFGAPFAIWCQGRLGA